MLLELRIGNLALAEDVVLRPGPGLCVLTGETGAGKSLIAGALALLTAERADRGLIRRGQDLAWVEVVCDLSAREDLLAAAARLGVRCGADGLLVLRRELRREGRGRVLINGEISSLVVLERLGEILFIIQSQHQQRELAAPGYACELLDEVLQLDDQRQAVALALVELKRAESALSRRRLEHELACEQAEMWRYQLAELDAAALSTREEVELSEAIAIKRHAQALLDAAAGALARLDTGPAPAREMLGAALAALRAHGGRSRKLDAALQSLEVAADQAAEAAGELEGFLDGFQADPRALSDLEERKALYEDMRRKYRRDVPGLLALRDQLRERVERQEQAATDFQRLEADCRRASEELASCCLQLHQARREGAARVAAAAEKAIRPLALPELELTFSVALRSAVEGPICLEGRPCSVDATGADTVRLLARTNPGEALGEVAAIASGGEMTRIHLGLTLIRRGAQQPLLRVFDEVDSGLGMDAATPVAWLLCDLARDSQALCITHLPTVAVHGRQHWQVVKQVRDGRTTLTVNELSGQARLAEIARQLGGEGWRREDAQAQLAYANNLLAAAAAGRRPPAPSGSDGRSA